METEKNVLFCAETFFQLMNAVILRMTDRADWTADLALSKNTAWEQDMLKRIEDTGLFRNVFCPDTGVDSNFWALDLEEKKQVYQDPELHFHGTCPIEPKYDEMFVPLDHLYWKMVYYRHVCAGRIPDVYMYDEGLRAYTMDLPGTDKRPYAVGAYPGSEFLTAIRGYYLHRPELYTLKEYPYQLYQIPEFSTDAAIKEKLVFIFGYSPIPDEPYIYIEDFFFADHFATNDFELFQNVAELVGPENLIVKRHPRDMFDRFTPLGYKTTATNKVPWEIQILTNDFSNKVLISVSSTAIMTPFTIFSGHIHVISLERMFCGENPTHKEKGHSAYIDSIKQLANQEEIWYHTPRSMEELEETVRYIRMAQQIQHG